MRRPGSKWVPPYSIISVFRIQAQTTGVCVLSLLDMVHDTVQAFSTIHQINSSFLIPMPALFGQVTLRLRQDHQFNEWTVRNDENVSCHLITTGSFSKRRTGFI